MKGLPCDIICACGHVGMDVVDFSHYPDREYQLTWLRTFLELRLAESGRPASDVTDVDVERLYVQVNKFSLVSLFFHRMWVWLCGNLLVLIVVVVLRWAWLVLGTWQPGCTLPRQQWSLLNRFHTGQGHCGACRKTWCLTDTDLCTVVRPKRCPTSLNPALLPSWTVVCLSFTLLMLLLLPGWPIMDLNRIRKKKKNYWDGKPSADRREIIVLCNQPLRLTQPGHPPVVRHVIIISESWGANSYTTWCTSCVSMVS